MILDTLPDVGRNPDYGLSSQPSFSVDEARFGDGYAQRRPSGINSARREWSVTWSLLDREQLEVLRDFLMMRQGVYPFWWTLPETSEAVRVICKEPPRDSYETYRRYTLSATFTEDHNP